MLAALTIQDEWRFTTTANGEQFVMITGTLAMLVLSADNLVFQMLRLFMGMPILVEELGKFGWMMLCVEDMSRRYHLALAHRGEIIIVVMLKMQEYAVKAIEVRISYKTEMVFVNVHRQRNKRSVLVSICQNGVM